MHPYVDAVIKFLRASLDLARAVALAVITRVLEAVVVGWLAFYYVAEAVVLNFTPAFMQRRKSLRAKVVLITGGAGGLGQELALRIARHKARVVVWDNDEKALAVVKERIEAEGYKVHAYNVDVTDKKSVYEHADRLKEDIGPVDILINNAGIVCGQTLLDIPDEMVEKTFQVNVLSHYWTTKAFLPAMMKMGSGHLVTIGSLTGLLGAYKCTDYSASKYATVGLHESLTIELKTHGYHKIHTTLVCPYFIKTGMFAGCKPRNYPMLEVKDAAKRIITAIKYEEEFVTQPAFFAWALPLKNWLPAKLNWLLMHRVIQGPQSMKSMRHYNEVEAA